MQTSAQPQALGFEGFFRGAYSYHFHNFWFVFPHVFTSSSNNPSGGSLLILFGIGQTSVQDSRLARRLPGLPLCPILIPKSGWTRLPMTRGTSIGRPSSNEPSKLMFAAKDQTCTANGFNGNDQFELRLSVVFTTGQRSLLIFHIQFDDSSISYKHRICHFRYCWIRTF